MQVKTFRLSVDSDDMEQKAVNAWLQSHRVLEIRSEFVSAGLNSFWALFVTYLTGDHWKESSGRGKARRIDYRTELDAETFAVFAALRNWRRDTAKELGIPAYAVFTDAELAKVAALKPISEKALSTVPGVGAGKVARYGSSLVAYAQREPPRPGSDT